MDFSILLDPKKCERMFFQGDLSSGYLPRGTKEPRLALHDIQYNNVLRHQHQDMISTHDM